MVTSARSAQAGWPPEALKRLPKDRKAASAQGSLLYFNSQPCRHGHLAARRTADARCTSCVDEEKRIKAGEAAQAAQREKAKKDAPKAAARRAKLKTLEAARDAKLTERREAKELRKKQRRSDKAAATRAAKKAATDCPTPKQAAGN